MKIGKQPKRWKSGGGNPNRSIVDNRGSMRATSTVLPDWEKDKEEPAPSPSEVRVYLDDERPCPEGWTLCRTPREFFDLLQRDESYLARITHLSLDWHLGNHQIDGVEVAKRLAFKFWDGHYEDNNFLPNLRGIGLHSSDHDAAIRMHDELAPTLKNIDRESSIRIRRSTPTF